MFRIRHRLDHLLQTMGAGSSQTADNIKDEALWAAASYGDVESVAHYMAKAADVNHRNKEEDNNSLAHI